MKKLLSLLLCILLLTGCEVETKPIETYVISGTIVERQISMCSIDLLIELDDGIKVPVWDSGNYSDGLKEGDQVRFEVKDTLSGYKVVGIRFVEWGKE